MGWMDEEPAESLWVRISRQADMGDVASVCRRRPDQEEVVAEATFRQLEEAFMFVGPGPWGT